MGETIVICRGAKNEQYKSILPQIEALLRQETDLIAGLANVSSALQTQFQWLWTGFYRVVGESLILGPFQGPVACSRIPKYKGVCGRAWAESTPLVVADVSRFAGHIACNPASRSEIVIPILRRGEVVAVLDIDSTRLHDFDETDLKYLIRVCGLIEKYLLQ